jgi:hypothetical protein
LYVFVRKDLSSQAQISVQAGHAILEATRAYCAGEDEHPSIIIFGIKSEPKLRSLEERIRSQGVRLKPFYEPDIGHQMTAFATEPVHGDRRKIFEKYTLL